MWNKFRNIQTILFSTYSLIIVIVFTVLVIWFYLWASDLLRKHATDSLFSMGVSMQEHIDSELRKMNDVSMNVMYSNLVKNHFQRYVAYLDNGPVNGEDPIQAKVNAVETAKELAEILTAAIGPSRPVEQLYLYDFKNKVYGNGFDNGERSYDPADKAWFKPVIDNQDGKYISLPVPDEDMTRFISANEKQYSVSLFRLFYDVYNAPMGIVEVKQYFNRIFKNVIEFTEQSPYQPTVLVYNAKGEIVYPLEASVQAFEPYIRLSDSSVPDVSTGNTPFRNPVTGDKELVSLHQSGFTGWKTVLIVSEAKLLAPLFVFAQRTVLVAMLITLFAILLSFVAAKRITLPILKIHRAIRTMRLEDLGSGSKNHSAQQLKSGLNELDQLHGSFLQMSGRLKQSMDELLLAQSQEMQTKLIALQSQMNPHFLYNTLATIHVMAEEKMNDQIIAMSENMSDFLRYLSSDQSLVHLEEEVLHTQKYLEVNQIRFGSKLQYAFDIDERILALRIPKLVIQPLVENALKFATRREPPWTIRVAGFLENNRWRIEVSDNGHGFTQDSLDHLYERIREVDETNNIPVLKLDGMGLLNIYIRMKLTYGQETIFEIRNLSDEGAVVIIGGTA